MAQVRRVGIVGAGLSGLAAALAAAAAGAQVDVFEASNRLATPAVHIDLVPNMVRDLASLGVAEACVRRGFAYQGIAVIDTRGRLAFEMPTPALAGARWPAAVGLVYAELLQVLHDAAVARGARVHWRAAVEQMDVNGERAGIRGKAGLAWSGDLLVLAGASRVAGIHLPVDGESHGFPQCWDYLLLPRPREVQRHTWILGPGREKALVVPTSVSQVGLALPREGRTTEEPAPVTPRSLRTRLAALGGIGAALGPLVPDEVTVLSRPVSAGLIRGDWYVGAALRIGASAHRLPPHFGQSAAQSVEDACVLGQLLGAGLGRCELLQQFMDRRAERAAQVHAITTQVAQWDLRPEPSTDLIELQRRLSQIVAHAA